MDLQSWQMDIDLSVGNTQNSQLASGHLGIYFLRNVPDKQSHEYAKGANGMYSGFSIQIKENSLYAGRKVGAGNANRPEKRKVHQIQGLDNKLENGELLTLNNKKKT
eukprot:CAMPEP_0170551894 /NCGR_PEP_ID=MMETSP0211-20121228/9887_1 /TAXON_ID=311385 /ORGANISM="Pseudokeronopsis sp., Strain OXSARD2" /LENGTH=106 /DNA_ID=CAMNT_0010859345 /DNA_START=125 /DNA_END=445 /DNA_ORIENTATION=+